MGRSLEDDPVHPARLAGAQFPPVRGRARWGGQLELRPEHLGFLEQVAYPADASGRGAHHHTGTAAPHDDP
ncbi:hypothetical protein AB0F81_38935 [Actinoplanes sp. NPDC024001]|uniref:hypothetical protein n=1 Tax=unclassified Actinoplanes TaxID=2626549 RepID=UPI002E1C0142